MKTQENTFKNINFTDLAQQQMNPPAEEQGHLVASCWLM